MTQDVVNRKANELSLYMQIANTLAAEIDTEFRPGDVLQSEMELAKRFGVNRHTLRRAIEVLVNRGIVGKLQGKGTIVLQKVIDYHISSSTRFTVNLERCGRHAESVVLKKRGIPADIEIAESLRLNQEEPVIILRTLRKMDGVPFSLSDHYFPLDKVYEVFRGYEGGSIHAFIKQHHDMDLKRTQSLISASLPDQSTMETLEITATSPILRVKSLNVEINTGVPIEYVVTQFKSSSIQLAITPSA